MYKCSHVHMHTPHQGRAKIRKKKLDFGDGQWASAGAECGWLPVHKIKSKEHRWVSTHKSMHPDPNVHLCVHAHTGVLTSETQTYVYTDMDT
jgi:hypothetical protein